nr:HAMP domain-containing sensor histidine kinase [Kiloniellales bacterium]
AANRAKTDFMAKMSQELRNPVNAIIGSSNILIEETWGPIGQPQYADHAKKIRENGSQLLRIVGFALEMAKADVGSLELNEEPVDICRLVQSAINLVQDTVADDAPPVEIEVPDTAPMVWGDERQLKQILINLLSNAVKFTPADGRISLNIRWNDADGGIDIEVGDTGIGMAEDDIPKALEQFGRIESQAFREYKGAGLGLPMVVAMAERHGGKLRLESELGKGTIATVWLPDGRIFSAEPEAADSAIA